MKYTYRISFDLDTNIVPQFVEYALRAVLEKEKISVIQGQAEPMRNITITEVKK